MSEAPPPKGTAEPPRSAHDESPPPAPEPTVGTGTIMAVGCLLLVLAAVAVMAAVRFLPHIGG